MASQPFSQLALVEQRLSYLEQREDANTRDILKLKSDNATLLSSNLELKQQNSKAQKEKKAVEARLSKLETETKDRLSNLTKEVTMLRGLQRLLNSLVVKVHENASKEELTALRTKVMDLDDKTEAKVTALEDKMVALSDNTKAIRDNLDGRLKATNDKLQALDKDVTEIKDEVRTNREKVKTQDGRLKSHETRIKQAEDAVKTLDHNSKKQAEYIDLQKTSVVKADIKPSKPLVTGTLTKLDCCHDFDTLGSCFKTGACEYHTPVKGIYGVDARLVCIGKGRIDVRVFCDEESISTGWTDEGGECRIFFISFADKGSKWNVRVIKEGEAQFAFCDFACFLLTPL